MLFQVSRSLGSICKDSKYCPWPLTLPKDTPSTHSYWKTIPTASSMALNDRAPTHCYAHICDTANWNQKCMTCTFFHRLPWHPQQIFCTSTTLQNLKTVSYTAKNLLTAFIYISIEEPRSCLIIAFLDRNRLGQAMLLFDLAESFPRHNINPGTPPALSQPRSCCHAAQCTIG